MAKNNGNGRPVVTTVAVSVDGGPAVHLTGTLREFSTGSLGYTLSGKIVIAGRIHQFTTNAVEVGSKNLTAEQRAEALAGN